MMNFCNQCGNSLNSGSKFCANCGLEISSSNVIDSSENSFKSSPWGKFFVFFIPTLFLGIIFVDVFEIIGITLFGINPLFSFLIVLLITTMLYQRHFKNRSWHSIIWGKDKLK